MSENSNKLNGIIESVKNTAGQVSEKAANTADGIKATVSKMKDDTIAKRTERRQVLPKRKNLVI